MNRWRARLTELQGASAEAPCTVQNVQNVQNVRPAPPFEHFEQFEQAEHVPPVSTDIWSNTEEERAAIVEYGAGVPRAWAEALARLDPSTPPASVPSEDWIRFIDACARFIDARWHVQANALGWGPLELFGCDRVHPFSRVEAKGLLWRIGDGDLVALTAHSALVENGAGDHFFRRRAPVAGQVLTWELVGEDE